MPVMDGFHLLKECKSDAKLHKIPFVFVTGAFLDDKDEELAAKAGVSAFIRKPVEPSEVIRIIEAVLFKTRPGRRGRKPKADKASTEKQFSVKLLKKLEAAIGGREPAAAKQEETEDTLSQVEDEQQVLLDTMTQGVVCVDAECKIVSINPAAKKILGLGEDQLIGKRPTELRWSAVHEDGTDFPLHEFPLLVALREGKSVKDVIVGFFNRQDELHHWINVSAVPQFRKNEETPYQVCAVFEDITDSFLTFKAVQENESRLNAMIENSSDAILAIDSNYCVISVNSAAQKSYSLVAGSLSIGQNILAMLPPDRQSFWDDVFKRALRCEHVTFEHHFDTGEGPLDFEFSANPIMSPSSRVSGISLFGRNITERKKNEQALSEIQDHYRQLIENSAEAIYVVQDGRVKFARSGLSPITGYTGDEIMNLPLTKMIHPDDLPILLEMHARRMRGEEAQYEYIYRAIHKSGEIRWVNAHVTDIPWEGRPASLMFQSDITEHKMLEETIGVTNRLFKMLFLCNEAVVMARDEHELLQSICNIMVETGGYRMAWVGYAEYDELKSVRPVASYGFVDSYLETASITWAEDMHGLGPTGKAIREGITAVNPDVSLNPDFAPWLEEAHRLGYAGSIALPLRAAGKVIGALNVYTSDLGAFSAEEVQLLEQLAADLVFGISSLRERRQRETADEALRESEQRFRKAVQSTTDIVWDWDIGTGHLDWYGDVDRMLGFDPAELPRTRAAWESRLHEEDRDRVTAALNRHAQTGEPYNTEYRIHRKDGSTRVWIDRGLAIHDLNGEVTRSVGACVDITEHRQADQRDKVRRDLAIALSTTASMAGAVEHGLDAALQISGMNAAGIYLLNEKTGDYVVISSQGYETERQERFHVLKADSENARLIRAGKPVYARVEDMPPPFDEQFKTGNWAYSATVPIVHEGKAIACLVTASHAFADLGHEVRRSLEQVTSDIGAVIARIRSREALQASEARYRFIADNTMDVIWALDKNLRYTYISPSVTRQRGYTVEEAMHLDVTTMITPSSLNAFIQVLQTTMSPSMGASNSLTTFTEKLELYCKDGSTKWSEISFTVLRDDKGEFTGLLGISRDITERMKFEAELRGSEEKYRALVENAGEGIIVAQDSHLKFANARATGLLGYSTDELKNLAPSQLIHPDDLDMVVQKLSDVVQKDASEPPFEFRTITKIGDTRWLEIHMALIEWEGLPAILNFLSDITQRKKAEAELQQALDQITSTLEGSMEAIAMMSELRDPYTAGHQRRVTELAMAIATEMGFSEDQLRGLRVAGLLHDVGKVYVPSEILSKPGKLTVLEKGLAKAHAEAGYDIVKTIKFPWPVHSIIRQHHERMDGSGYPFGLKGQEILIEARVLAVADVVEAMMSHRPYRPALGLDKALDEIITNKGTLYDETIVDICVSLFREKDFNFTA
jgi:PAS domain S-box-containing protein/putative nucleotidyltransferase with HDIG domain